MTTTDKSIINIDDGSMGGTPWICFKLEVKKSYYFDSSGGSPENFFQQLPKLITFHEHVNHDTNSKVCGMFC